MKNLKIWYVWVLFIQSVVVQATFSENDVIHEAALLLLYLRQSSVTVQDIAGSNFIPFQNVQEDLDDISCISQQATGAVVHSDTGYQVDAQRVSKQDCKKLLKTGAAHKIVLSNKRNAQLKIKSNFSRARRQAIELALFCGKSKQEAAKEGKRVYNKLYRDLPHVRLKRATCRQK